MYQLICGRKSIFRRTTGADLASQVGRGLPTSPTQSAWDRTPILSRWDSVRGGRNGDLAVGGVGCVSRPAPTGGSALTSLHPLPLFLLLLPHRRPPPWLHHLRVPRQPRRAQLLELLRVL